MGHFVGDKFAGPFFLCIMSHGEQNGVMFNDGEILSREQIVSLFTEDHCKNLENRAKVVLIQACRGFNYLAAEPDGTAKEYRYEPKPSYKPDCVSADRKADVLVFQSCIDDRISFRSTELGSRFVYVFCQVVCKKLMSNQPCEIMDVTKDVNSEMKRLIDFEGAKVFATSEVTSSSLVKNLYLSIPERNWTLLKGVADEMRRISLVQHQDLADDGTSIWCTCKTGCRPTSLCRCQREGRPCGPGCHHAEKNAKCVNKSRRCACDSTCQTETCGCYKAGGSCGRDCHPRSSMCRNGEATPSTSATPPGSKSGEGPERHMAEARHRPEPRGLPGSSQGRRPHEADTGQGSDDSEARCGCKAGCGTRRCGCMKAGRGCNATCHPNASNCENRRERPRVGDVSAPAKGKDSRVTGDSTAGEDSVASCGCKTGCGTRRCGCLKVGKGCNAKCHPNANNCENKGGRGSTAPDSAGSVGQGKSKSSERWITSTTSEDSESDDSDATTKCGCKTGCGTLRCGCMKAGKGCSVKCHPSASNCENKGRNQSKPVAQSSGRLSSRHSRATEGWTASEDSESDDSDATTKCGCKTGCGTLRCGCMKAGKGCNAKCHPSATNCENKGRNQSKSVAQSSERLSSRHSRATEGWESVGSEAVTKCSCKTGCGSFRCGCMKAGQGCNVKCHPNESNCENKRERGADYAKNSIVGQRTAKEQTAHSHSSSSGVRQATEHSCRCLTGCGSATGTRRCGCNKAGKPCSAKCHPAPRDCANQNGEE
ncbi:tenascin-X-like isoform X2 [Thrips palmi]|nr:tenascin-X-like isoform X2 [Thrips palmi]